jgi:hypothetical protein
MQRSLRLALALSASLFVCTAQASKFDASVNIVNQSAWDIHQLYLSPVDEGAWGNDQLGDHVIESGGSYLLHSIPCDSYDVRIVDEDGDACVIGGVDMCANNDAWVITDDDLLTCQVLTEE